MPSASSRAKSGAVSHGAPRCAAAGVFAVADVDLTAALIKPLLQDWYVKRAKHRKRGIPIQRYIAGVTAFVERAIAAG